MLGDTAHRKIEQDQGNQVKLVNSSLIFASGGSSVNLIESRIAPLFDLTQVQLCAGRVGTNGLTHKLGGNRCDVMGGALMHFTGCPAIYFLAIKDMRHICLVRFLGHCQNISCLLASV